MHATADLCHPWAFHVPAVKTADSFGSVRACDIRTVLPRRLLPLRKMGRSCSSCACSAASYVLALLLANNALQVSVHIQDGPVASDNKHAPEVLDTFFGTYRTGEADISEGMKTGMPIKLAADDFVQTVRVLLAGLFMLLPLTWLLPSLAPNRDDPDVETGLLERERPRPPMTNLSNDLDFIDLELGISEPVAIEPPLQAEVDEASDDRQAVSASEVASKQPLQTEVDDASDDPQAVSASEVASEQPLQTEVDHASDDRQAMSALDVVAIEQPLQTEVGEASYDPQAVSASEVASEQPLQTEVDHASDDPQAVSSSEAASEQPRQTVDGDIDEVEDCWGSSDEEEEDEEETEERIDNSSRDELILHSSTMALRVDALEARDVHEEAARIVMARLDHLSGAQGQELDEDSAASLLDPQLVMFGAVKVIGGLMLKSICNGRGWEVTCRGDLVFYF